MKNLTKRLSVFAASLLVSLLMVAPVFAQTQTRPNPQNDVRNEFSETLIRSGLFRGAQGQLPELETGIGRFIASVLGLIGVATFALIVYAGGLWVTAAGNEDKIEQAQRILKGAVLGLVVIFSAYILVNFALQALQSTVSGGIPGGQ